VLELSYFREEFSSLSKEKKSILCIGLDPALPKQRSNNVIPEKYIKDDENIARLDFCLDIVEQTQDFSCAFKPNYQYVVGFTKTLHQKLTDAIRKSYSLSILDYKLNDIKDTVESAIFHLAECGYDAITFNPFMGNLSEVVNFAHENVKKLRGYDLGIIVLTLTSNPEAIKYMKEATINSKSLYLSIAEDVKTHGADGCVVGATGHVTEEDIKLIRAVAGEDKILLVPGIGVQKGDPEKVIRAGGKNVLINVGRDIIYSEDPSKKAKMYRDLFNKLRKITFNLSTYTLANNNKEKPPHS